MHKRSNKEKYVYVCVCVKERERERERKVAKERGIRTREWKREDWIEIEEQEEENN